MGLGGDCKSFLFCCADYVDDVFGEGSIWPKDPYNKAKARLFTDDFGNKVCEYTPSTRGRERRVREEGERVERGG